MMRVGKRARHLARSVPGARRLYAEYRRTSVDAVVVSYPKSGRTWLRALIGQAIASARGLDGDPVIDVEELGRQVQGVPRIRFVHAGSDRPRTYAAARTGRVLRWVSTRPVLLLVRDPRDVVVSYWLHRTRRMGEAHELSAFLRHPEYGIDRVIEFMNVWDWNRDVPPALRVLRYEDLQRDTPARLREVVEFFEVQGVSDASIIEAVDRCSFARMRATVASGGPDARLSPVNPVDPESSKVRRGKVGGYVDYLDDTDMSWANERISARLVPAYGYVEHFEETAPT